MRYFQGLKPCDQLMWIDLDKALDTDDGQSEVLDLPICQKLITSAFGLISIGEPFFGFLNFR